MASNFLNKNNLINIGLGIIFGATLSKLLFQLLMTPAMLGKASVSGSSEDFTMVGGLFIFSALAGLVLLLINKRLALTIGGWFLVVSLFGFLIMNRETADLFENYRTLRNLIYLFLVPYFGAHIVVHGIFWLITRKRKVLTLAGIVNFALIVLLTTFAFFLTAYDKLPQ